MEVRVSRNLIRNVAILAAGAAIAGCATTSTQSVAPQKWTAGYSEHAVQAMETTFGTTALKPRGYRWRARIPSQGPTLVVVNLTSQRAYVLRDGELVGVSSISSGRPGKETPEGYYSILDKKPMYYSKKYDNAPMPWMEEITDYGIALHGGELPGYPDSHGCIRLPAAFAKRLYGLTQIGSQVVVED